MASPAALLLAVAASAHAGAGAGASGVSWSFGDSVSACPAGDSVAAGHPARLRIAITWAPMIDGSPAPRAGLPPESLWVTCAALTGDVRVNDQSLRVHADDSTDTAGRARITVTSLSGAGTLRFTLYASGEAVGSGDALIRSADSDGDGVSTGGDPASDLDFDGTIDAADAALAQPHLEHGHREALYGTLVRRTNLCETCADESEGTLGESTVSWSPDGRWLAFTIHTGPLGDCSAYLVASDPADGDALRPFTFPPAGIHDYDTSWSPLGTEIAFGRDDNTIWVKGVPGVASDTSLRLVTRHHDGTAEARGDLTPAISPDGIWVAFSRKGSALEHWQLWKTPIDGDTTRRVQLTADDAGDDMYPQWSSDGAWLVYDRVAGGHHSAWKVPAAGGAGQPVLASTGTLMASTPAFSPDGAVILAGVGPPSGATTHTLAATLAGLTLPDPRTVESYAEQALADVDPVLSPRLSPDGTRLALRTNEIYAARRNMLRPPRFETVAGLAIAPATPFVDLGANVGATCSFRVAATDPDGEPLTFQAFFLRDGMQFDAATQAFAWTPPGSAGGTTANVRFQVTTPSGGTAYAIARVHVTAGAGVPGASAAHFALSPGEPNPFVERTSLRLTLPVAAFVRAEVFDAQGRRQRVLAAGAMAAGVRTLEWDGRDEAGARLAPGLYLCRVSAGGWRATARLLMLGGEVR